MGGIRDRPRRSDGAAVSGPWKLVAVHWMDAYDDGDGWTTVRGYSPSARTVMQVGWLWPDCLDGYMTLVSSHMPDEAPDYEEVSVPCHIPLGMVLEVVELVEPVMRTVGALAGGGVRVVVKAD